jgi:hypothetical protein
MFSQVQLLSAHLRWPLYVAFALNRRPCLGAFPRGVHSHLAKTIWSGIQKWSEVTEHYRYMYFTVDLYEK